MKKIKYIESFDQKSDSKVLVRLKDRVVRGVNLKKNGDIYDVAVLATYLHVTDDDQIAIQLLDQIVFPIEFNPNNRSLCSTVGRGLVLRALLAEKALGSELIDEITTAIREIDDIKPTRQILKKERTLTKSFIETRMERKEDLSEAEISSQKIQCEAYASMILEDAYFKIMLPHDNLDFSESVKSEIDDRMLLSKQFLVEALISRRKDCQHRIPRHESFNEITYRWRD